MGDKQSSTDLLRFAQFNYTGDIIIVVAPLEFQNISIFGIVVASGSDSIHAL